MGVRGSAIAAIAVMVAALAACSSPVPSPSSRSVPTPPASVATPAPSPPEVADTLPEPDCQAGPVIYQRGGLPIGFTLVCDRAVEAAAGVLPHKHLPVVAVDFGYGTYCSPDYGWGCPIPDFNTGYVIFDTVGLYTDLWVQVTADEAGTVAIIEGPSPFLPPDPYFGDPVVLETRHHSLDPSV